MSRLGFTDWVAKRVTGDSAATTTAELQAGSYIGEMAKDSRTFVFDPAEPIGKKTTPTIGRISLGELEAAYISEPNVFNSINKTVQLIMAPGYTLEGDARSVSFFETFFKEIGSRGGELEWEELLNSIFKHQLIFGSAWTELIQAKRDRDRTVDLQFVDPKKMDYAKDGAEKIALDQHGNSLGYVETMPFDYGAEARYPSPEGVVLAGNQIFFPPNKVAHFKLYTIGDGFYPVGLIEPSYKSILRKVYLEEAHANSMKKNGFPRVKITYGDENHQPTNEQLQRTLEKVKQMENLGIFCMPFWVKMDLLEAKAPEKLQDFLSYYTGQIVTGTGLPMALVTGSGAETNRRTLERQEAVTKLTLKDIVRRTLAVTQKDIIKPVAKSNHVNPVRIKWGEISVEALDGKAKRLAAYVKNGLLTPDEKLENLIRSLEGLSERGKDAGAIPRKPKQGTA